MLRLRVDPERNSRAATELMTSAMPPITSTQPAAISTGLPRRPSRKRSAAFQPIHTATAHSATALTAAASTSARSKPKVRLTRGRLACRPGGQQGQADGSAVGKGVSGVGKQRQAPRQRSADNLEPRDGERQRKRHRQSATGHFAQVVLMLLRDAFQPMTGVLNCRARAWL